MPAPSDSTRTAIAVLEGLDRKLVDAIKRAAEVGDTFTADTFHARRDELASTLEMLVALSVSQGARPATYCYDETLDAAMVTA